MFAQLEQFSNDTTHPDLESVSEDENFPKSDLKRARELYEELRQMSVETGIESIENIMETINTSNESISSIIPYEKREELSRFELTLKQMIEEAKQMAEGSPTNSELDLYRTRKSPSIISMSESIVSVIERRNSATLTQPLQPITQPPPLQKTSPEVIIFVESPMTSHRPQRSPQPLNQTQVTPIRPPRSPSPNKMRRNSTIQGQPSPTKIDVGPPNFPLPSQTPISPQRQKSSRINGGPVTSNGIPTVGADRYEEIIVARSRGSRGSSVVSNGRRSIQGSMTNLFQPNTTMAMREEPLSGSMNKLNQALDKINKGPPSPLMNKEDNLRLSDPHMTNFKVPSPQPLVRPQQPQVKPLVQVKPQQTKTAKPFEPKQIEPSIDPIRPEILEEARKRQGGKGSGYQEWFLITLTYSVVFITIILMSNITPNGKLYIHFTAFWSMVLYFFIDDVDHTRADVLDSMVENFVKVKK